MNTTGAPALEDHGGLTCGYRAVNSLVVLNHAATSVGQQILPDTDAVKAQMDRIGVGTGTRNGRYCLSLRRRGQDPNKCERTEVPIHLNKMVEDEFMLTGGRSLTRCRQ